MLQVRNLSIQIDHSEGKLTPVKQISFALDTGETLAVVGESGSGKTMTALALLDLLPRGGRIVGGEIFWQGEKWADSSFTRFRELRGQHIAMIFQDAQTALNPVFRIGTQMVDVLRTHFPVSYREAQERAVAMLAQVGLSDPGGTFCSYPHQLSGGMAQRVLIAMALSCRPRLVIADEPTTALDISTQYRVLRLLRNLQREYQFALLLISHDMSVVAAMADRVVVMCEGEMVEYGKITDVLENPTHHYTRELLAAQIVPDNPAGGMVLSSSFPATGTRGMVP